MLCFLQIRKSIIKIQIMCGESKRIHKFEIYTKKTKVCYEVDKNSISFGIENVNGD